MNYQTICPVCDTRVDGESDFLGHTLMEQRERCEHCKLYNYEYLTGGTIVEVGFWEIIKSYTDTESDSRNRQTEYCQAIALSRKLFTDPDWPLWTPVTQVWMESDPNLFRAFSDWCRDRGHEEVADQVLRRLEECLI